MTTKKRKTGISRLIEIAGTKRWWLIISMLLAVCASIAQFIPFVSAYHVLSELATNAANPQLIDKNLIWHWGYIALGGIIGYGIFLYISNMSSHIAAFNILYELRMSLAQKMVRLPLGFFTKRSSGELKKVMGEDVDRIELFVAHHIPDIISAIIFPLLTIVYLFYADWRLAIVVLFVFIVAMISLQQMMGKAKSRKKTIKYLDIQGKMNSSIVEYIRGIQVVKIFNRSTENFERLQKDIENYRKFAIEITKAYAPTMVSFSTILSSVLLFLIPAAVFALLRAPSYPDYIPTILMFLILGGGIFFPLNKLMFIGGLMQQNTVGVGLIDDILDKPEIKEPVNPKQPKDASIRFENVSFAYDATPILKDISFTAYPGTVTALVGPSGAGKSTIAMLAARFWDISSGNIYIGGTEIKDIPVSDLMNNIAFVFQDNMLFFDTIEENIRMGNKKASFDDVVKAAKAAQCDEFIQNLDNGYQTLVGEGGTYLSGGEQQRIALARAILKNAPIILLDEATAYADPENEGKILETFSHLIAGKTVLVIAHRLSTISNADQILVIEEGQIAEQGKQEELLAKKGIYSHMWKTYTNSRDWTINKKEEIR